MRAAIALLLIGTSACSSNSGVRSGTFAASAQADSVVWAAGARLPSGRDHHGTFVTSGGNRAWLWVVGGNDYKATMSDAWRAEISADGTLGQWTPGPPLPGQRAGMGIASNGRYVFVSGGKDSAQRNVTDIFKSRIGPVGMLGEWTSAGNLPGARFHHATLIDGNFIYVVGGLELNVSVPAVLRGTIGADGNIVSWDSLPQLPRPRSHHSMFMHERAIYMVGGLEGNPAGPNTPLSDVVRASIRQDGTLGPWTEVSKMANAYGTHATAVYGGAVWLFGGVEDNARFVDVVLRGQFRPDGTISPWRKLAVGMPAARSHVHQVPVYMDKVYSTGGSNRRVVTPDVQIGRFVKQ